MLSLSVLARAAYAILSLLEAPIAGVVVAAADQSNAFTRQILGFVFGLAPALLVFHLVRRSGEGLAGIGLEADQPSRDLAPGRPRVRRRRDRRDRRVPRRGGARRESVRRSDAAARPLVDDPGARHERDGGRRGRGGDRPRLPHHEAAAAVVAGRRSRWARARCSAGRTTCTRAGAGSSGTSRWGRCSVYLFLRWGRRTWPFVVAHVLLDVGAGVGFILFRDRLPGF